MHLHNLSSGFVRLGYPLGSERVLKCGIFGPCEKFLMSCPYSNFIFLRAWVGNSEILEAMNKISVCMSRI